MANCDGESKGNACKPRAQQDCAVSAASHSMNARVCACVCACVRVGGDVRRYQKWLPWTRASPSCATSLSALSELSVTSAKRHVGKARPWD